MWWRNFFRSFRYAGAGVWRSIRSQRNLRFHLCATVFAHWLGILAQLERGELALISLCCGVVIGLELMNTAIEAACDRISPEEHPLIRNAKDAAAGGVLMAAVSAAAVACWLMGGWIVGGGLWSVLSRQWGMDLALALALLAAFFFVRGDGTQ
jgi:diacylglycerol kinase